MEQGLEPRTLAQGIHLCLACCTQPSPNLGQPQEKRLYWTLIMCLMLPTRGNQRASFQHMSLQLDDLGPRSSNNASFQSK
jgi:hypothetical protein